MYKILFLAVLALGMFWDVTLRALSISRRDLPLPENVRDLYDEHEYRKWRSYSADKSRLGLFSKIADTVVLAFCFGTNVFANVYYALPGEEWVKSLLLLTLWGLVGQLVSLPLDLIREFKIEEKYGFSRTTGKTFAADQLKDFVLNTVLNAALYLVVAGFYKAFGVKFFWITYAVLAVFVLAISMLSATFQRLYNKLSPLEDGELRTVLTELFAKSGYQLKDIYVMDASRRTTKVNAYCAGLGRFKKIVLYDNLVGNYTPGEIAAVFSHELGHYKHRDNIKMTGYSLILMLAVTAAIAAFVLSPEISVEYGFDGMSIVFGLIALMGVVMEPLTTVLTIPHAALSRRYEYRADGMAVSCGYGEELVTALKKLSKDNLSDLNPHPVIVALEYTHPTVSQRIDAIEKAAKQAEDGHDL